MADTAGMAAAENKPKATRVAASAMRGVTAIRQGAEAAAAKEAEDRNNPIMSTLRTGTTLS
jgi:hypothetical protein